MKSLFTVPLKRRFKFKIHNPFIRTFATTSLLKSLAVGSHAPDFTLPSTSGTDFTLSIDFKNKPCIIFFYPGDFTRVCTKEAQKFNEHYDELKEMGIEIVGISRDDIETHYQFKHSLSLKYDLLSDRDSKVCEEYDAIYPYIDITKRVTYLLNKDHVIEKVVVNFFDSNVHYDELIEKIKEITQSIK